jgi:HAD superfamily hydrolase (TIGR01509 family)
VLGAVLFDWGSTLMDWRFDDALVEAGHRAGLAALRREGLPAPAEVADRFRERYLPFLWLPDAVEEIEYPGLVRELLGAFGIEVSDDELDAFLEAEHAAWAPARVLGSTTHALLDALRGLGLKLGLVSNALDPPWLLHRDLDQLGVASRLDAAVFSCEVGKRKPHPAIFEAALERLGVEARETLFVGDDLRCDVGGAGALGMTTVQALWFRADDRADGREPDFQAFTQMDVLNFVRRLSGEK